MSQPPQYPPGYPPPGGVPPGGWGQPPGSGDQPPGGVPPGGGPPGGGPPDGGPPQGWGPGGPGDPYGGPPRRSKAPLVIVLVVIAALAVGGGVFLLTQGEDRSDEEQAYIDALTVAAEANEDEEFPLSEEENRCLAAAAVDTVGVDRLRDIGSPDEIREDAGDGDPLEDVDLDLDQAGTYFDNASDCIDFREVFVEGLERGQLTEDQIDCVNENISDDVLRQLLVAEFAEDEDAAAEADEAANEATEECDLPG